MIRIFFLLLISVVLGTCSGKRNVVQSKQKTFQNARYQTVKIYEAATGELGPCEPSIYISPADPNTIVAGSVIDFIHISADGGHTWQTKRLSSSLGVWGDPCVVADNEGAFYYFHLSDPDGTNWRSKMILDRIVVQRSDDGGNTWSDGVGIGKNSPKQQDKEWAAVHPKTGALHVAWTEFDRYGSHNPEDKSRILLASSHDKGHTWSKPMVISELEGNSQDNDETVEGAVPAVGRDGEIYVTWSYNEHIYFDKSVNNGHTWLAKDIVVTDQPGGWTFEIPGLGRSNGMPVTCIDNSNSEYAGTIYVNWTDQRNGTDNTDVFIAKSIDGGATWSPPVKVNTDTTRTHQFLTWMSIDPKTGYLYVVYYDRSRYPDNRTDVTLAVSYDGGEHFTSKIISERPFTPVPSVFFGDYNNIHAFNGIIRPVWTHYENGKLSIWTALIDEKL